MTTGRFLKADQFQVRLSGRQAAAFLGQAAGAGIRLRHIVPVPDGYTARLNGRDFARLRQLAEGCGVQVQPIKRRGPGRMAGRFWTRPGIWIGCILFAALLWWLSGVVWVIDFGALDADTAARVRVLLEEHDIREGSRVSQDALAGIQSALAAQPEAFGWAGVNFIAGRLCLETTAMKQQQIRVQTPETALYARDNAEVTAIQVESGFPAVQAGQYVAEGQLLANALRADREGRPVVQSASGRVVGRVRLRFSAARPLSEEWSGLTGRHQAVRTLHILGFTFGGETGTPPYGDADVREYWQPLQIGRVALPGCLYTAEYWERAPQAQTHTQQAAQALARRDCLLQLKEKYPDAVVEQQTFTCEEKDGVVYCNAEFLFQADIAVAGAAQPLSVPDQE